mmetsp:Transcript_72801/g.236490  ORF Transcript_72801/g.236490 Transcript_72801/m.236490 type:complete len:273 (-) Transcript_72801:747-1565(-)
MGAIRKALLHVGGGAANVADGDRHVAGVQVLQGQLLHFRWESRREHHGLAVVGTAARLGHAEILDDGADLGLHPHVQHAVGLVQDQVLDRLHADDPTIQEVLQTSRSADRDLDPLGERPELRHGFGPTVDASHPDIRAEGQPPRLDGDLLAQLPRRREHKTRGADRPQREGLGPNAHGRGDDWRQECCRLAAACLRADHDVRAFKSRWYGMFLHRRRGVVPTSLDIGHERVGQVVPLASSHEAVDGLHIAAATAALHGDVVVLLETAARGDP